MYFLDQMLKGRAFYQLIIACMLLNVCQYLFLTESICLRTRPASQGLFHVELPASLAAESILEEGLEVSQWDGLQKVTPRGAATTRVPLMVGSWWIWASAPLPLPSYNSRFGDPPHFDALKRFKTVLHTKPCVCMYACECCRSCVSGGS